MITASVQIFLWHLYALWPSDKKQQTSQADCECGALAPKHSLDEPLHKQLHESLAPQREAMMTANTANTKKHIFPRNATKVASGSPMLLVGLTRNLCLWAHRTAMRPPRIGLATQPLSPVTLNGGLLP